MFMTKINLEYIKNAWEDQTTAKKKTIHVFYD